MNKVRSTEQKVRAKVKRERIQDALILTLHLGTGAALIAVAPAAMRILKMLPKPSFAKEKIDARMRQARSRLAKHGLIRLKVQPHGVRTYELTAEGRTRAETLMNSVSSGTHIRRWDGKWRIVIFDIWERRRVARDALRRRLRRSGFTQIQASVWVTPYDCEDLISFVRTELKLGPSLIYIIANEIENDSSLRSHFKLPLNK